MAGPEIRDDETGLVMIADEGKRICAFCHEEKVPVRAAVFEDAESGAPVATYYFCKDDTPNIDLFYSTFSVADRAWAYPADDRFTPAAPARQRRRR